MMDIDEIKRYIHVGYGYVEVSREYMYNGLCRRTFIRENKIQIDFCTAGEIELNEGETTFYFGYENFEDVIKAAEKFLEKPVSEWTNYNRTWNEWYFPETPDKNYVRNFFSDLQQRKLIFPENFRYMRICSIYALGVFIGKISPDNITADIDLTELYRMNHDFTEY
ncbi:MAG: hypothetical protein NC205_07385 [Prevotella sp.]|nr:hypothetical protein [Alistipes senegalensis]MCM1358402.1 hypothetical protein [Prevotella sp.]MCM1473794.1 hypothetical protein [Muribaculaceae bacterium]